MSRPLTARIAQSKDAQIEYWDALCDAAASGASHYWERVDRAFGRVLATQRALEQARARGSAERRRAA